MRRSAFYFSLFFPAAGVKSPFVVGDQKVCLDIKKFSTDLQANFLKTPTTAEISLKKLSSKHSKVLQANFLKTPPIGEN